MIFAHEFNLNTCKFFLIFNFSLTFSEVNVYAIKTEFNF